MKLVKVYNSIQFTINPRMDFPMPRVKSGSFVSEVGIATKDKDVTFCRGVFVFRGRWSGERRGVIKRRKKDSRLHTLHSRTPPRDSRPPANRRGAQLCPALFLLTVSTAGLSTCAFNLSPFDLCLARLFERYRRLFNRPPSLVIKPVETLLFNV